MLTAKEQKLLDALLPRADEEGVEIVTLEIVGAKKSPTIRVYVDTEDGVGFEVLSSVQAWVGDIMDKIDPFPGAYMLEVSSPGIDRPLRTLEHFARFVGETAQITMTAPVHGRTSFTGSIVGIENETVLLKIGDEQVALVLKDIKRAHLKGTIDFSS